MAASLPSCFAHARKINSFASRSRRRFLPGRCSGIALRVPTRRVVRYLVGLSRSTQHRRGIHSHLGLGQPARLAPARTSSPQHCPWHRGARRVTGAHPRAAADRPPSKNSRELRLGCAECRTRFSARCGQRLIQLQSIDQVRHVLELQIPDTTSSCRRSI